MVELPGYDPEAGGRGEVVADGAESRVVVAAIERQATLLPCELHGEDGGGCCRCDIDARAALGEESVVAGLDLVSLTAANTIDALGAIGVGYRQEVRSNQLNQCSRVVVLSGE